MNAFHPRPRPRIGQGFGLGDTWAPVLTSDEHSITTILSSGGKANEQLTRDTVPREGSDPTRHSSTQHCTTNTMGRPTSPMH